jgi:hypothetical protein
MNTSEQGRTMETGRVPVATIDKAGWGMSFIWIGVAFLADVGWGVGLLGVGIITLGAQAVRSYFALKLDRFGLVLGILFVAAGVLQLLDIQVGDTPIPAGLVPILFIVVGVAFLVSIWLRRPRD